MKMYLTELFLVKNHEATNLKLFATIFLFNTGYENDAHILSQRWSKFSKNQQSHIKSLLFFRQTVRQRYKVNVLFWTRFLILVNYNTILTSQTTI